MNPMRLSQIALLATSLTAATALSAQVVVITSAKNSLSKLTADQVSQIFLGQSVTFYTGGKAEPLDLAEGSATRSDFYQKVLGKTSVQMNAYWSKQTFSGKGQPPRSVASAAELIKLVAENPKYLAYVDKSAVDSSVKVVLAP